MFYLYTFVIIQFSDLHPHCAWERNYKLYNYLKTLQRSNFLELAYREDISYRTSSSTPDYFFDKFCCQEFDFCWVAVLSKVNIRIKITDHVHHPAFGILIQSQDNATYAVHPRTLEHSRVIHPTSDKDPRILLCGLLAMKKFQPQKPEILTIWSYLQF